MEPSKKPLNVLIRQMNSYVGVVLKNNVEYRGMMIHCDNYMNIILNGASEYNSNQLIANYGKVLVRGNNILYITLNLSQKKEQAQQNQIQRLNTLINKDEEDAENNE